MAAVSSDKGGDIITNASGCRTIVCYKWAGSEGSPELCSVIILSRFRVFVLPLVSYILTYSLGFENLDQVTITGPSSDRQDGAPHMF